MNETAPTEARNLKRHRRRVALNYRDVRPDHALRESGSRPRLYLDGGQVLHALPQEVGREPRPWPNFEQVVPELDVAERPRQYRGFEQLRPVLGTTVASV